jgi:hypothetical protein
VVLLELHLDREVLMESLELHLVSEVLVESLELHLDRQPQVVAINSFPPGVARASVISPFRDCG